MSGATARRRNERGSHERGPRVAEDQPGTDDLDEARLLRIVEAARGLAQFDECSADGRHIAAQFRRGHHERPADRVAVLTQPCPQLVRERAGGSRQRCHGRASTALVGAQPIGERQREPGVAVGHLRASPSRSVGKSTGDEERLDRVVGERFEPNGLGARVAPRAGANGRRDDGDGIGVEIPCHVGQHVDRVCVEPVDVVDQERHRRASGEVADPVEHRVGVRRYCVHGRGSAAQQPVETGEGQRLDRHRTGRSQHGDVA